MAGESAFSTISALLPAAYQAAYMYAQKKFVMQNAVNLFGDRIDSVARNFSEYTQGTVSTGLSEGADLTSAQVFARNLLRTITPTEIGTQYLVTDQRMASDDVIDVMADLTQHLQNGVFQQVESDLLPLLGSLTAGTVGTAGSAVTWATLYGARAILAANGVPGPYNVVLHEYTYLMLANQLTVAGVTNAAPLQIRDDVQSKYYVASVGDMNIYTTGLLTAGTAVAMGMYNRTAIALDIRRPLRLEPQRDASRRGTEINATMIYAVGAIRPNWGVRIVGTAPTPT